MPCFTSRPPDGPMCAYQIKLLSDLINLIFHWSG
jgi:hypothetical protein